MNIFDNLNLICPACKNNLRSEYSNDNIEITQFVCDTDLKNHEYFITFVKNDPEITETLCFKSMVISNVKYSNTFHCLIETQYNNTILDSYYFNFFLSKNIVNDIKKILLLI